MFEALFHPGQVVATPAALAVLAEHGLEPITLLRRHVTGDWGDIDPNDRGLNELSLEDGSRILSVYKIGGDDVIWIMTEAVGEDGRRASTCIMLPSCY